MASSHNSSKSLHLPCKNFSLVLLLLYLLLIGSCTAIRTGQTMRLNNERKEVLKGKHHQPGFPYQDMVFNFFPKGSVPPSGPSKRHNAVVDSTPNNWVHSPFCMNFLDFLFLLWFVLVSYWWYVRFSIRYQAKLDQILKGYMILFLFLALWF